MPEASRQRSRSLILLSGLMIPAAAVLLSPPAVHASAPPSTPAATPTVSPPVSGEPTLRITLRAGDTLWGLSEQYAVPVTALQAANDLGTSTLIYAGRTFVIPGRTVVSPGETLDQVSAAFGVSVGSLQSLNGLSGDLIGTGATLFIPAPPTAASAPTAAPAVTDPVSTLSSAELTDLAHLVQSEAGNQPFLGQVAVAAVVLNRVNAAGFPKTVAGVIFQPGQFDSVANGTFWMPADSEAYQAAEAALGGEDPTGGALYYYNPSLSHNAWMEDLPVLVTIGSQVFCR